jgi:thiamine pyrophosphate-dependent acetolactate synthase large subunit-like protein
MENRYIMTTLSDQVVLILSDAGIKHAYGVPGDAIDLILASIHGRDDFEFYLTRHEECAGFMASAYAKLTGEMGVVLACQGPGSAHLLEAMYDAKMDKVPMLVITGQIESAVIGTNTVQEINQILLFEDATCFNREVRSANNLVDILQLAIQMARAKSGVAHVSIATDVLRMSPMPYIPNKPAYNLQYEIAPTDAALQHAADILNHYENISILYGGGCFLARDALIMVAELLSAPLVHTVRSKDIIDNHHPHYVGGIGMKGSRNGCYYVKNCEALLVVGCSFAWREFYPEDVPIVQIDLNPERLGVRCHVESALLGDAKITLERLAKKLQRKQPTEFLHAAQHAHIEAIHALSKKATLKDDSKPIDSPVLTHIINNHLTDDAIVTVDAGTVSVWANNWLRLNGTQRLIGSTELGTLGFAMPAALACQIANPDKLVIALCGDGGFQMTMGDFSTAMKYRLPIKVIIYNNFSYHFIELEQMKEGVAQCYTKLNNPDYAKLAEAFGGCGFRVTKASEIEDAIYQAFSNDKPTIVDVLVNPDELIQPNKLSLSLMTHFVEGLIKTKLSKSND